MLLFRKHQSGGSQHTAARGPPEIQYGPTQPHNKPLTQSYNMTGNSTEYCHSTNNDYYRTWQMQRHIPQFTPLPAIPSAIPPPSCNVHVAHMPSTQVVTSPGNMHTSGYQDSSYPSIEHIYESPKFGRKDYSRGNMENIMN